MRPTLVVLAAVLVPGLGVVLGLAYGYWQRLRERERHLLSMRHITTPWKMDAGEQARLKVLRAPGWALWRWVPDLWKEPTE